MLVVLALCEPARAVDGMVSWWRFDEGSGTIAYDSVGTNDGTVYGATWADGIVEGALSFDGIDDYVDIPTSAITSSFTEISIFMWINPNDWAPSSQQFLLSGRKGTTNDDLRWVLHTTGELYLGMDDGVEDPWVVAYSGCSSGWCYVGFTYDGTTARVYSNAVEVGNDEGTFTFFTPSKLLLSTRSVSIPRYFNGLMDEVAIDNRAWCAEEIEERYLEAFDLKTIAIRKIERAIAEKLQVLETIATALEDEWAAYDALEELLASGDYGDLNKGDIVTAKQKVHSAIQHQQQSKDALEKSIEKLEDALEALGV